MQTILVQGAMEEEIGILRGLLPGGRQTEQKGYSFYETTLGGTTVILSKTGIGILHACIATALAIEKYHPDCVINQGTAGGHIRTLEIGDIILGETAVYINNMRTPTKTKGQGSNALEWRPGEDTALSEADPELLARAEEVPYEGRIQRGRLGSGDLFSRETDRIDLLHLQLGELCEDMESSAVYKTCHVHGIPVLGIRIISNNELTGKNDFQAAQEKLQHYIYQYLQHIHKR